MIPTGNKSEITVARAVLIHSIIKGHDVRVEELIADNIAVLAEGVQGRSAEGEEENYQHQEQPNFVAYESSFQQYKEDQQQGFQFLNEKLASMKIRQEQFFENMQKAQS
ncbi:hypothetical protein PIB30_062272 [Stylosanthes scabra]|uniref:Uncharacterized protein n=1 Tax=Stylosanthes scabra TaxID=79078 RepID=A0ABU6RM93_9FABA|nr:hypothetical protein [Stylosanthes scabra]